MFIPLRFLQVSLLSIAMAGCASQQTTAGPGARAPDQPSSSSATQASAQPAVVAAAGQGPATTTRQNRRASAPGGRAAVPAAQLAMPQIPPPIQAGRSSAAGGPLLQAEGTLTPDIKAYAAEVSRTRNVPLSHVEGLLRTVSYDATAARLMKPNPQRIRRSWTVYRKRFIEPVRIRAGQEFWAENRAFLEATERQYGVPASIIVAIIGVETIYGRHTGNFKVLDALATLGFRFPDDSRPERGQLFRDQLADLIELDYNRRLDARTVTGSFAGAMGLPQFMPGSLARFAADGDGDGRIDLLNSRKDAIVSVARFLRLHGWIPGLPVFAPATLPRNPEMLAKGGLEPTLSWADLAAQGASVRADGGKAPAWTQQRLGIVDLVDEARGYAEYRIGTPNFFAITHYNRSYFYATSVADLAVMLADAMGQKRP